MGTLAAGIKEIFATAKTTGSNVMLCGNDGTPDGHMTMANLASVLGEQIIVLSGNEDLNNIILDNMGQRTYKVVSTCQNKPIQNHDGYMTVYKWSGEKYITQVFYDPNNDTIYIRSNRYASTVSFEPWSEFLPNVPHFYKNYSSINSLIDAVNPFRTINMLNPTDSWDNLQNGIYCFANSHLGADVAFGFMIQYGYQSDRVTQFAIGTTGIAKRYNVGNGWGEWSYSKF